MIFWTPSQDDLTHSQMAQFRETAERAAGASLPDYESLHAWSVAETQAFWELWLKHSEIRFEGSALPVYTPAPGGDFIGGKWFPQLKLNFAENLLARLPEIALVGCDELGRKRVFTRDEVLSQVRGLQLYLKTLGVGPGDAVAGVLPNVPETIIAMLATASLGAVWSSCSPDFGVQGILDRFTQVNPKVLFLADAYSYNGKTLDLSEKNAAVLAKLSSIQTSVTIPFMAGKGGDYAQVTQGDGLAPEFLPLPFSAPLYILFSSGTTGQPKCMIHSVGGTLLQHKKELMLHCDLRPAEKILYYTTCGWMMWNWLVSASSVGATVYCYDGSPASPRADSLWNLIDREQIEVFGTSAKFIASCRTGGVSLEKLAFEKLRLVCSTGSPLLPEDFDYFYAQVRPNRPVQLASIAGGTDIVSCFMLGTPLKPIVRGEIQGRGLGMDVKAFSSDGKPLVDERGELVCVQPFPSMPVSFLNDLGNAKYRKAYFERFPGVWHHGDFVTISSQGGVIIHGRSDATLNPGGVRIGTAEIYRQVETHPAVQDSLVVGQRWEGDERVVLFVKLKDPNGRMDDALIKELRDRIRTGASPRHVPAKVIQVGDIPYTVSGKKVELAVKAIVHGEMPNNVEALSNPNSLELYKNLEALRA